MLRQGLLSAGLIRRFPTPIVRAFTTATAPNSTDSEIDGKSAAPPRSTPPKVTDTAGHVRGSVRRGPYADCTSFEQVVERRESLWNAFRAANPVSVTSSDSLGASTSSPQLEYLVGGRDRVPWPAVDRVPPTAATLFARWTGDGSTPVTDSGSVKNEEPVMARCTWTPTGSVADARTSIFEWGAPLPVAAASSAVSVEWLSFSDAAEARHTFWHSSAHLLGWSIENVYASKWPLLLDGPPLPDERGGGFYYDCFFAGQPDFVLQPSHLTKLAKFIASRTGVSGKSFPFETVTVPMEFAHRLFAYNPFKVAFLDRFAAEANATTVTLYKCGNFVDLCRGPHIPHTGHVRSVQVHQAGAAIWMAASDSPSSIPDQPNQNEPVESKSKSESNQHISGNELEVGSEPLSVAIPVESRLSVQRVYGRTFPSDEVAAAFKKLQDEAQDRDHRRIGRLQRLFYFHSWSPGSAFLLPHGTRLYQRLTAFMRTHLATRGYDEVMSPLIFNRALWECSGHWDMYRDNMFLLQPLVSSPPPSSPSPNGHHHDCHSCNHDHHDGDDNAHDSPSTASPTVSELDRLAARLTEVEATGGQASAATDLETYGVKPMNCPGHCLLYRSEHRSYRQLPIRWSDFSPLHRNEISGALTGLTRVRLFHQDDAHIFCREDQIGQEIRGCLELIQTVYDKLGFRGRYSMRLSTRPTEGFVGNVALWDRAEQTLAEELKSCGIPYVVNPGDGAFYGPKIDIAVRDAIGRAVQCATVQLDFQLPRRFNLKYTAEDASEQTPVMIHRAILGSVERLMAMLAEHTAGKWPFWLSPRQVLVCSVSTKSNDYADRVARQLADSGFYADADVTNQTLSRKLVSARTLAYFYVLVVGERESTTELVNVRSRAGQVLGNETIDQFISRCKTHVDEYQ